jgi:hypothetical protein
MLCTSSVVGATPSLQKECNWIASAEWDAIKHYYPDLPLLSCMIASYRFGSMLSQWFHANAMALLYIVM